MFYKGENKLHKELEIGTLLKSIRDSNHTAKSLANTKEFSQPQVYNEYQTQYPNTLQISLNTLDSIEEEYQNPIPVTFVNPNPVEAEPRIGE